MIRRPPFLLVALAIAVAAPAACSSEEKADDETTTTASAATSEDRSTATSEDPATSSEDPATSEPASGNPPAEGCETLSELQDLQAEMDETMAGATDWADMQERVAAFRPDIAELYAQAASEVPQLEEQLGTIAKFTDDGLAAMAESSDMDEYSSTVEKLPGMQDMVEATLAIHDWTTENCGFDFAG
jgi:hypothetical protein